MSGADMSGTDPTAPSQPSHQTGLNQSSNPASKTTTEQTISQQPSSEEPIENRVPSTHNEPARPSALGAGDTGPLKQNNLSRSDAAHTYSSDPDLDGEQMRAPGEGEVAEAVKRGGGGGHEDAPELGSDMERKREEHDAELKARGERTMEEIEQEEKEDWTGKSADVGEALGGRDVKVVLAAEE